MAFRVLNLVISLLCLTIVHSLTFPSDLVGNFTVFNDANRAECPPYITQTTYTAGPVEYSWQMPHNTIYNGLEQCDSVGAERKLVYYNNSLIPDGVPKNVSQMLEKHGWNIEVNYPLHRRFVTAGETYYVGFEDVGRFCQESSKLNAGTMVFVFRPWFPVYMPIDQTQYIFEPEYKYMIITPTFEEYACMYRAYIDGSPPAEEAAAPAETGEIATEEQVSEQTEPVPSFTTPPSTESKPTTFVPNPGFGTESFTEFGDMESTIEPVEAESEKSSCFPANAQVQLQDGTYIHMRDLKIGHVVKTGTENTYSRIFSFTHKIASGMNPFVEIKTAKYGERISLSHGHYLYINNKLVAAKNAKVGDTLITSQGVDTIASVMEIQSEGLYNPQTIDGNIIVNDVLASTYTTAAAPAAAHALLSPIRSAYQFLLNMRLST